MINFVIGTIPTVRSNCQRRTQTPRSLPSLVARPMSRRLLRWSKQLKRNWSLLSKRKSKSRSNFIKLLSELVASVLRNYRSVLCRRKVFLRIIEKGEDAIIHFPSDGKSETVSIRGKESGVAQAKKALMEEAAALRLQSFNATVTAPPEYHKFLIGRNGANMKEIREKTGCRIAVPGKITLSC